MRTLAARRSLASFTPTNSLSSVHSTRADQMPPANPPEWHDWRMGVPSSTPTDSPMLRNQGKLPRLPVVPLDETLARLRRSCQPLAKDEKELREVEKKIEAFGRQGGIGRKLQDLLEQKREEKGMRNWLAKVRRVFLYLLGFVQGLLSVITMHLPGNRTLERDVLTLWVLQDWDEQAYMAYRDSIIINVSYYFG